MHGFKVFMGFKLLEWALLDTVCIKHISEQEIWANAHETRDSISLDTVVVLVYHSNFVKNSLYN